MNLPAHPPTEPHKAPPPAAPALVRALGAPAILFLTLSATTPASSVFVIIPGMLRVAGSGALIAMLIAAVICVATAFIYAELSAAWPIAGGEYVMVARTLGPLPGFVILGVNVVNNLIFPPIIALGLSAVLARVIPGLPVIPVAILVLIAATAISLLNIRLSALVTGLFLIVELAALIVLAGLGMVHPATGLGAALLHPTMPSAGGLAPASFAAIGTATTIAVFALNGYGMAVYFGEDMRDAERRIAPVILQALAITVAIELAPLAAVLVASPDLLGFATADDPFGRFVDETGGPGLGGWIALSVGIAILNAAIVSFLAYARFLFASGRDGVWGRPLDRWLQSLHPRFGSPWAATLVIGGTGIGCCFIPIDTLLIMSGAGLVLTYAAIALAAIVGRATGATAHAPYRMPFFPLWPVLTLLALGYVGWSNWLDVEEGRPGLIATAVQMIVAALYYILVVRRRGPWIVLDPPGPVQPGAISDGQGIDSLSRRGEEALQR